MNEILDIETLNASFSTAQDLLMKDKTLCLRLKGSSPPFREKPTLLLHQYFFMAAIRVFQLNLKPAILNLSIDYILSTKRFESNLFTETLFVS